jgi:hypothetical protein
MKKMILALACISVLGASTAMAAPVNKLANNETAVGVGTKEIYIEHKFTPKLTVGYQKADRDEYNKHDDVYGQYDVIGSELKILAGYRSNLPGDNNNFYGGLAASTPTVMGWNAYASYVKGADFGETQLGINKNIVANVDLNVNYHNFSPDNGHHENGVGAGVTVKF